MPIDIERTSDLTPDQARRQAKEIVREGLSLLPDADVIELIMDWAKENNMAEELAMHLE
jgi:hypothetical protein